jgi:hypothetical protein
MVEVLLALCIGGLVLTAASSLLVTISRAWAERPATRDAFDAHVNGVAHFLSAVLEEATLPTLNQSGDELIDLQRPVGFSDIEDPLIHFYLREGPPILFWPTGSASRVHCYFHENGEGLNFLWFSELQELEKNDEGKMELEDEEALFNTLISPFCSEIRYRYFGDPTEPKGEQKLSDKEWDPDPGKEELWEDVGSGKFYIPDFIQLVFKWEEENLERKITLPIKRIWPSGVEEEPN